MLKNKHIHNQNYSYSLADNFTKNNESLCVITEDNDQARYLVNELKLILDEDEIIYFQENDILPYDHFSVPEKITKSRFKIINKDLGSKNHILIASVKSLFERFQHKDYYKSLNNFKINSKISLSELVNIVESLNHQKKSNVENINEYSVIHFRDWEFLFNKKKNSDLVN